MSKAIYVVGHKKPDTDAIVACIAYAHLLRAMGEDQVIAARQGDLRKDTEYLLDRFGVDPPVFVRDVKVRVGDVMVSPAPTVNLDDSLYDAGRMLQERDLPAEPVVDDDGRLCGLIKVESFSRLFMGDAGLLGNEEIPLTLPNLVRALEGRVLEEGGGKHEWDTVFVASMGLETMVQRIEPDALMVIGDRVDAQRAAIEQGIGAIIVTGGFSVEDEILELARQRGVTVIASLYHTFKTVQLLNLSVPVRHLVTEDALSAEEDDLLDDAMPLLAKQSVLPVVTHDRRVIGLIARTGILRHSRRRVVLVDHNERNQSIEGLEEAEIISIIDHHRIYDIRTDTPIYVRIEPLGASSTIIYKLYREHMIQIPKPIAGIMLGAVLADTIMFKSPTSTEEDRRAAEVLAQRAGVDLLELGRSILAAASDVADKRPRDLLLSDMKEFSLGDLRFGISSLETINANAIAAERDELLLEMKTIQQERGFSSVMLIVVDIAHERTEILVQGYEREVADAFGCPLERDHRLELPGVVSRKKQVVPLLPTVRSAIHQRAA